MGYHDNGILKVDQELLEPCDRIEIQVVGRLVEKQDVRVSEKCLGKKNFDLLAACQVSHLAQLIASGTGLKVNVAEHPVESVALGLARVIKDDNYKSVAYAIEGMGNGGK